VVEQDLQKIYVNSWGLWSNLVFPCSNVAPSHPRSTAHRLVTTAIVNPWIKKVIIEAEYYIFETDNLETHG
jgi:hypothetical protein